MFNQESQKLMLFFGKHEYAPLFQMLPKMP